MTRKDVVPAPDLSPQQRLAITFYTDPLLPTFGNKVQSSKAAGYDSVRVFDSPSVEAEIERIEAERAKSGRDVADYMGSYAIDAARELVAQLSEGRELTIRPPDEMIDEMVEAVVEAVGDGAEADAVEGIVKNKIDLMKAITGANKIALQAAKVRHDALELLIRYHLGHPEQRITHREERDGINLADLSDAEMKELGTFVDQEIKRRGSPSEEREPQVVEAEFEVED